MGEIAQQVAQIIEQSLINDTQTIQEAAQQLMEILERPNALEIFIITLKSSNSDVIQNACFTYIYKILQKRMPTMDLQEKQMIFSSFLELITEQTTPDQISKIANICNVFLSSYSDPEDFFPLLEQCSSYFNMLILSSSIEKLSDEFIGRHLEFIVGIAYSSVAEERYDYLPFSTRIYMRLLDITTDPQIYEPIIQFISFKLNEEQIHNLTEVQSTAIFPLIAFLMMKQLIPQDSLNYYLTIAMQTPYSYQAVNSFDAAFPVLSEENLQFLIQCSITVAIQATLADLDVPPDALDIPTLAVSTKSASSFLREIVFNIINDDEAHQIVAIHIIGVLMSHSQDLLASNVESYIEMVIKALTCESTHLQKAALTVISQFEDITTELQTTVFSLMSKVCSFLTVEEIIIRNLAYQALISLCQSIDNETPDESLSKAQNSLFETIWPMLTNNLVIEEDIPQFLTLVSSIVSLNPEPDDDIIDTLYDWVNDIMNENVEIGIRAYGLSIVSSMLACQETLYEDLVPISIPTLEEAVAADEDDIMAAGYDFLRALAVTFRQQSIDIITPYVPNFIEKLKELSLEADESSNDEELSRININIVRTAAVFSGFVKDNNLLEALIPAIISFITNDSFDKQNTACLAIINLAPGIKESGISKDLFTHVIHIIESEGESDLLETAFTALRKLFKHCHSIDDEFFFNSSFTIFNKFFSGEITYLENVPCTKSSKASPLIQCTMDFLGAIFKIGPSNVDEICKLLIDWICTLDESTMFPIFGALTDALDFCQLDPEIPAKIVEFVSSIATQISDPDLEHNIAYFMGIIIRKYPQYLELVSTLRPVIDNWWNIGHTKDTGYQEILANIASFYLAYANLDQSFDPNLLVGAFKLFPPADLQETETMCQLTIQLFNSRQFDQNVIFAVALAIIRLLTETDSMIYEKRKLSTEMVQSMHQLLKSLITTEPAIKDLILQEYSKKRSKLAKINSLLC